MLLFVTVNLLMEVSHEKLIHGKEIQDSAGIVEAIAEFQLILTLLQAGLN